MKIIQQLKLSLLDCLLAFSKMRQPSYRWMAYYSLGALIVFSLFIWLLHSYQAEIKQNILGYLFPESWFWFSELMIEFFFESQTKSVIINLILTTSLVLASVFLFPIKESFSAKFEHDAQLSETKPKELPLYIQAIEETRLFFIYIAVQSVILLIGYYPYQWTSLLATSLSYLFLFFTFSIDFISPTLQRHRVKYSHILRLLAKMPLLTLSFGILFTLPIILLSQWIFSFTELSILDLLSILFIVNILFLSLAIPCGTFIASKIKKIDLKHAPLSRKKSIIGYSGLAFVLVFSLLLHFQLAMSFHHKSQLLKANYEIDWSSISFSSESISNILKNGNLSRFSIDITVTNPTQFDIDIEKSEIVLSQKGLIVSRVDVDGFNLPAGDSKKITLLLNANSNFDNLSNFSDILDGWNVDVYLQVWPGIPFIINVVNS